MGPSAAPCRGRGARRRSGRGRAASRGDPARGRGTPPALFPPSALEAPASPASPAGVGWSVALEGAAKALVALAVPDLGERLLEGVAQDRARVVAGGPGRDA